MCYYNTMIRLVILVAIFFAVYPYVGTGFDAFSQDVNLDAISNVIGSIVSGLAEIIDKLKT